VPETGTSVDVPLAVVATPPPVEKKQSSTNGSANKLLVFGNTPVKYTVTVRADGVVPTGDVAIYDGLRQIATATLTEGSAGKATVTLPKLGRGLHLLTAHYQGSDTLFGSIGWPSIVLVL